MKAIVQVKITKLSFKNVLMTLDFIIPSKNVIGERGKAFDVFLYMILFQ